MKLTKNQLRRIIKEEHSRLSEGQWPPPGAAPGGHFSSTAPEPLTTGQLFALFNAGFSPDSVAGLNQGNLGPEHIEALQKAGEL